MNNQGEKKPYQGKHQEKCTGCFHSVFWVQSYGHGNLSNSEMWAKSRLTHKSPKLILANLRARQQRLDEAFWYERITDKQTDQEQLDKLREEIALAEIEERGARMQSWT
jgi:hypothetical protein